MENNKEIKILDDKTEAKIKSDKNFSREAENMRENYRRRAFVLMIQLAIIIGVPAFLALWGGRKIDALNNSGLTYTLILLGVAFVCSWTIIIIKYIKFDREIKRTEEEIKRKREEQKELNK